MALGAALATDRPQAYAVVPGPGLLNSSAALITAYGTNAPVLGIIGQIPQAAIGRGLAYLHEVRDQAGIIARLVDFNARIRSPAEAPGIVAKAFDVVAAEPERYEVVVDQYPRELVRSRLSARHFDEPRLRYSIRTVVALSAGRTRPQRDVRRPRSATSGSRKLS